MWCYCLFEEQMKCCHFALTRKWYNAVSAGKKWHELRSATKHWRARLKGATHAVFTFGCWVQNSSLHFLLITSMGPFGKVNIMRNYDSNSSLELQWHIFLGYKDLTSFPAHFCRPDSDWGYNPHTRLPPRRILSVSKEDREAALNYGVERREMAKLFKAHVAEIFVIKFEPANAMGIGGTVSKARTTGTQLALIIW